MRALTVHQPWAGLLVGSFIPLLRICEVRSWDTNYRGTLLIHAALETNTDDNKTTHRLELMGETMALGAILGSVELYDTKRISSEREWKKQFPISLETGRRPYGDKTFLWLVRNQVLFQKPITCRGLLGLWKPSPKIALAVRRAEIKAENIPMKREFIRTPAEQARAVKMKTTWRVPDFAINAQLEGEREDSEILDHIREKRFNF